MSLIRSHLISDYRSVAFHAHFPDSQESNTRPSTQAIKVLIVEDHDDIRNLIKELLELEGYNVLTAGHGKAALETLRSGVTPDLILLDLMMPVMDGFEFGKQYRSEFGNLATPIVVLSADGQSSSRISEIGAKTFLKKPIDIDKILEVVSRYTKQN